MIDPIKEITRLERRLYLRCAAGALAGAILLALAWTARGIAATATGIAGALVILASLLAFLYFVDTFYKIKGRLRAEQTGEAFRESYIEWPRWLKKWGWTIHFLVITPGILLFASMHENDFGGLRFVWHSIFFGIGAGILVYLLLRLKFTGWSSHRDKSIEIGFYITLVVLFLTVCLGPVINHSFASAPVKCNAYYLEESSRKYVARNKYIHVRIGDRSERFQPPPSFRRSFTGQTDSVILCVRKGWLGYDYVKEFRLPTH
ncbi:MAG: hypothetical protein ABW019_14215 [Chitinophagaceae bacterium]